MGRTLSLPQPNSVESDSWLPMYCSRCEGQDKAVADGELRVPGGAGEGHRGGRMDREFSRQLKRDCVPAVGDHSLPKGACGRGAENTFFVRGGRGGARRTAFCPRRARRGAENTFFVRGERGGARRTPFLSAENAEGRGGRLFVRGGRGGARRTAFLSAEGRGEPSGCSPILPFFAVQATGPDSESRNYTISNGSTSVYGRVAGCAVAIGSSADPAMRSSGWGIQ